MLLDAIPNFQA